MTAGWPTAAALSIQRPISSSQGMRSASVRGSWAAILAMLPPGWKASPSAQSQPRRPARAAPTVDLPLPETPVTTTTGGAAGDPGDPGDPAGGTADGPDEGRLPELAG